VVFYNKDIKKDIKKGQIPKEVVKLFTNVFQSLDQIKDLNLFDIKQIENKEFISAEDLLE
jgi:hypothetical protein